jgi:hypothetical protein
MTRPVLQHKTVTIGDSDMWYATVPIHTISLPDNYCAMDMAQVEKYRELLRLGFNLEPVLLFDDRNSQRNWLIDGRHRFFAHVAAGRSTVRAFITNDLVLVD